MAKSRQAKETALAELTDLLQASKLTVVAKYDGTNVRAMQDLRRKAAENATTVKVAKNRVVRLAISNVESIKDVDTTAFKGQLLYAFNADDEVAPAQVLNEFAKTNPNIEFVGAVSDTGEFFDAEQVKQLANLPSKDQLRGQLVGTIAAPLSGFANVLAGNIRGFVTVLGARAEKLEG